MRVLPVQQPERALLTWLREAMAREWMGSSDLTGFNLENVLLLTMPSAMPSGDFIELASMYQAQDADLTYLITLVSQSLRSMCYSVDEVGPENDLRVRLYGGMEITNALFRPVIRNNRLGVEFVPLPVAPALHPHDPTIEALASVMVLRRLNTCDRIHVPHLEFLLAGGRPRTDFVHLAYLAPNSNEQEAYRQMLILVSELLAQRGTPVEHQSPYQFRFPNTGLTVRIYIYMNMIGYQCIALEKAGPRNSLRQSGALEDARLEVDRVVQALPALRGWRDFNLLALEQLRCMRSEGFTPLARPPPGLSFAEVCSTALEMLLLLFNRHEFQIAVQQDGSAFRMNGGERRTLRMDAAGMLGFE